jgi:acyl-CoA thioester hydrolase
VTAGPEAQGAPPAPADFVLVHPVDVRFRDIDVMGHAHHSLPLVYWEEARARYWREIAGRREVGDIDYVMGELAVRWHRRIPYPARLRAGVRVTRLGRSSFEMEYGLWDEDDALLASGRSTQVLFDYAAGRSAPLDEETRRRIEAHEGRPLGGGGGGQAQGVSS